MRVRLDPPHKVEGGSAQEPKSHPPNPNFKPWPGLGSHLPPNPPSKGGYLPPNPPSKGGAHFTSLRKDPKPLFRVQILNFKMLWNRGGERLP